MHSLTPKNEPELRNDVTIESDNKDNSTTSLSSVSTQKELQLGERVIVQSSQGSKTGVLRFMGSTDFAPGEWCGVELDEPVGKNDGQVGDKRS